MPAEDDGKVAAVGWKLPLFGGLELDTMELVETEKTWVVKPESVEEDRVTVVVLVTVVVVVVVDVELKLLFDEAMAEIEALVERTV